ncbi:protein FAR1-RELATED SEQUENCE 8-like [Spinacia oleracea]|uniref:Protein FAR1-RELATED SEQUENCE 8-like n=1 Tax=Spinacia oleracea TaxID=3562 RepID=A0ABM3RJ52_SPIOL|nr:protein FAR1-RELATED SEQUENCE 8-like [Spinacia oleracea]
MTGKNSHIGSEAAVPSYVEAIYLGGGVNVEPQGCSVGLGEGQDSSVTLHQIPCGIIGNHGDSCGKGLIDIVELQSTVRSGVVSSDTSSFVTPSRTTNCRSVDDNFFGISPRTSIQSCNVTPNSRIQNSMTNSEEGLLCTPEHAVLGDRPNEVGGTSYIVTNEEVVPPPTEGLIFGSWEDVEEYYKRYAKQQGFGVCRPQATYNKLKEKRGTTWRCECYGDPYMRQKREAKKRAKNMELGGSSVPDPPCKLNRKSKKCHCTAMLYASVNGDNEWEVRKVVLEHLNHQPTPSKWRGVKEYRMATASDYFKEGLMSRYESGAPVSQVRANLAERFGGLENVILTEKDIVHKVQERRRLKMEGGDANAMMNYFEGMQKGNDKFFHAHRLDVEGGLKDIMWVDARSRVAFNEFGEVVCFDATYLTNNYELPFCNFVGVNHHGQSLLLGCALLSHEDVDTFSWLFRQWRICMGGRCPDAILTDQAPAMIRPLRDEMPEARHRWCLWHIMNKIPTKLGSHPKYKELKKVMKRVVYESLCVEEFENKWSSMKVDFEVANHACHVWLDSLYKDREMWVPAFMNNIFWAGMKTTQRVESINSFFDGFLERSTKLYEFPKKYCEAMNKRCSDEKDADANNAKYIRKLTTGFNIEAVFQKLYTDNKFREVQIQCEKLLYCVVKETKEISKTKFEYVLEDRVWLIKKGKSEEILTNHRRFYLVKFCAEAKEVSCMCKMFETRGILCRHCIRILDQNFVVDVPEKYILRRWRKDVYRKHMHVIVSSYDPTKTEVLKRFDMMMNVFEPICEEATFNDEILKFVVKELQSLEIGVRERVWAAREKQQFIPLESRALDEASQQSCTTQVKIKNPVSRSKKKRGRPLTIRHKAVGENNIWTQKSKAKNKVTEESSESDDEVVEGVSTSATEWVGKLQVISKLKQKATKMLGLSQNTRSIGVVPDDDILLSRNSLGWEDQANEL